ncbi:MAG: phosphate ABC transporter substrate-binding/OmpA family protein [Planctomycetota bacterium]|nr:phosphate ABC transporter substrate-binding/OmpA family protein [Planctomycetota bacterium]
MDAQGPSLKPGGKILLFIVVVGLFSLALYKFRHDIFPTEKKTGDIDKTEYEKAKAGQPVTTVQDFKFVAPEGLPEVKGVSGYEFTDNTVVFPINVWGGWAPIIAANNGFAPSKDSVFYKEFGFKVDLQLIDDPGAARAKYASGSSHVLWGTLDMIALVAPALMKDPRTAPRVVQQIDWSYGGDGVVVRQHIKDARDLRGKKIVLAQNSPSHFYILDVLISSDVQPREVDFRYTTTAFEAAYAFVANEDIDACVSWAPDIYNIIDPREGGKPGGVRGARLLTTTKDASNLIADVWAVRADFMRDHPDIVKNLVIGIFKGMDIAKKNPEAVSKLMADGFGLPAEDCLAMMGDAHITNYAENKKFFLTPSVAARFESIWQASSTAYKMAGILATPVRPDQVKDDSILKELDGMFPHHVDEYVHRFKPVDLNQVRAEVTPILVKTIKIKFDTNNSTLDSKYDATIPNALDEIGKLAGRFGAARIIIEGNCDTSRKGYYLDPKEQKAHAQALRQLSEARAEAVRQAIIEKFKFDPEKFMALGNGWDKPVILNASTEADHAENRRVEVKVLQVEGK